jgi:3',5'-cyclic AMP phosphodiesterase CpdA
MYNLTFPEVPAMTQTPIFTFCVSSDLHFMAWRETGAPVEWVAVLDAALQDIAGLKPHLFIVNGDLTNGKERDYQLAMRVLRSKQLPSTFFTMGNHEYYGFWEPADYPEHTFSVAKAKERFLAHTGMDRIYYAKEIEGCLFVFLSQEEYDPVWKDAGWISAEQLKWLEHQLQTHPGWPVFVFFHQPLNDTVADSNQTCPQSEAIQSLLARRPGIVWFSGHTHSRMDQDDQIYTGTNTLYVGGGCLHNEFPQSRWVDVYSDRIVLRLRDHQYKEWLHPYEFEWRFPL